MPDTIAEDQFKLIADQQAEIVSLKETIASQQKEIDDHKSTIAEHEETIADQEKEIADMATQGVQLSALLTARNEVIEVAEKKVPRSKPTVSSSDGRRWKFKFARFVYKQTSYAAEDAALDQKLIDEIANTTGQGILSELH